MIKGGSKFISLDKLKEIKENSYRTKCSKYEYSKEEIDNCISDRENKKLEDEYKRLMKQADQIF